MASLLCATLRIRKHNSTFFEEYQQEAKPFVIAFWHGSMVVGWFLHRPRRGRRIAALVSRSGDGEILSATLGHWGYTVIRGSSHVGGKEAMQLMVDAITDGNSLCVTPDGPTGPRHRMKMGVVRAAQRSQAPLFLAGIAARRKINLQSWDQFEIPFPFSSVSVAYSDPITVPPDLRDAPLDEFLTVTESRLKELCANAEQDLSTA
jgi:hypothetical protein